MILGEGTLINFVCEKKKNYGHYHTFLLLSR